MTSIKEIFLTIKGLIFQPNEEWKCIYERNEKSQTVQNRFYFYLLFFVVFSSFLGTLINYDFSMEKAVREMVITLSVFVATYYLSILLFNEILIRRFNIESNYDKCLKLISYSTSVVFLIYGVEKLIPSLFFLYVFFLSVPYNLWIGSGFFFPELNDEKMSGRRTSIMFVSLGIISVLAAIFFFLMKKLML